jgi:hypothetical protein
MKCPRFSPDLDAARNFSKLSKWLLILNNMLAAVSRVPIENDATKREGGEANVKFLGPLGLIVCNGFAVYILKQQKTPSVTGWSLQILSDRIDTKKQFKNFGKGRKASKNESLKKFRKTG